MRPHEGVMPPSLLLLFRRKTTYVGNSFNVCGARTTWHGVGWHALAHEDRGAVSWGVRPQTHTGKWSITDRGQLYVGDLSLGEGWGQGGGYT